jgi:hypothetical protein
MMLLHVRPTLHHSLRHRLLRGGAVVWANVHVEMGHSCLDNFGSTFGYQGYAIDYLTSKAFFDSLVKIYLE